MPGLDHAQQRLRLARGGPDGGDDLGAAHRLHGIGRRGRPRQAARSIAPCSVPRDPLPRVGARARIAHFGGGFELGTVLAVHEDGRRVEVRGEGGEVLEFVLSPATARFVLGRRALTGPRLELLGGRRRLTRLSGGLHVGEVLGAVLAQRRRAPTRAPRRGQRGSARAARAGARSARRRSPSARPGARTAARRARCQASSACGGTSAGCPRASARTRAAWPGVSEPRRVSTLPSASL